VLQRIGRDSPKSAALSTELRAHPGIGTDGDQAANADTFARLPRAANLTPAATQRAYRDKLTLLARFLTDACMPTDVDAIRREHVEAFITDQLARLAPASAANRYSSVHLRHCDVIT